MYKKRLLRIFITIISISLFTIILLTSSVIAGWVAEPNSWNLPDKWYMNSENGTATLDTTEYHSSSNSVKLTGSSNVGQVMVVARYPWYEYTTDTAFTFSAQYKASGGYNGIPRISVVCFDGNSLVLTFSSGKTTEYITGQTGDTGSWTTLSGTLTIPVHTSKILVQFETEGTTGTIWFDDIDVHDNSVGTNKALNADFETLSTQPMSDADFFGVWNSSTSTWTTAGKINYEYDPSGLQALENAVKSANGNYTNAKAEYLSYIQTRTEPTMSDGRNSARPTPMSTPYQTYWADKVVAHDFNQAYMQPDINWNIVTGIYPYIYMNCLQNSTAEADKTDCKLSLIMEGGPTLGVRDYSSSLNNGTVSGSGSEWSCSKSGNALKLGSSNTYVSVADSSSLDITDELTVEGWFRYEGTLTASYVVYKNSAYRMNFSDSNSKPGAAVFVDGAWRTVTTPDSVVSGNWYHLTMTYSSTLHTLKLYVNGILKAVTKLPDGLGSYTINTSSSALEIGRDSSTSGSYFNGYMDHLRISNIVRLQSPISMYEFPETDTNTKLLFRFDSSNGTSVTDSSSSSNTGTITGANYKWSASVYGECFRTNGTGYISVADSNSLDLSGELTIEGWFRFNGNVGDRYVLQKGEAYGLKLANSSGHPEASVWVDSDGDGVLDDGELVTAVADSVTVQADTWYHLAMTYSSTRKELKIFVNKTWKNTAIPPSGASYLIPANTTPLSIGRGTAGTYFDGFIENVRITNRLLSEDDFVGYGIPGGVYTGTLDDLYWYTGNETYADELLQQMVDWIKDNPYRESEYFNASGYSSYADTSCVLPGQWIQAYAAARLRNMTWYMHTLRNSTSLTADRLTVIMKSMYQHAQDIAGEPTRFKDGYNLSISTLQDLLKFLVVHPYLDKSSEWTHWCLNKANYNLKMDVYPDGLDCELTPHYHDFERSCFMQFKTIADEHGLGSYLAPSYSDYMERMYSYQMNCIKPDGTAPSINDSDAMDFRDIVYQGGTTFSRDDMKYVGSGGTEGTAPTYTSIGSVYGGQYFMRSGWGPNDEYMAIDMGPRGISHSHADQLSFILSAYGKNFITDPGYISVSLTPWIEYEQNGKYHNEMLVDGKGQKYVDDATRADSAEPNKTSTFIPTDYFDFAKGIFNAGYSTLPDGSNPDTSVSQERKILFVKPGVWVPANNDFAAPGYWILHDIAKVSSGTHTITDQFLFSPNDVNDVNIDNTTKIATTDTGSANLRIIPVETTGMGTPTVTWGTVDGNGNPTGDGGWVSYVMNQKYSAPLLKYTKENISADTNFDYILFPVQSGSNPTITTTRLIVKQNGIELPKTQASAIKVNISGTGENDYTMISDIGTGDKEFGTQGTDKIVSDAEVTFVKRDSSSNAIKSFMLMNGRKMVDQIDANGRAMINTYTNKNKNNITVKYSGTAIEIVTDLDFSNGDALRIYRNDIATPSVTVNGTTASYKTDGSYIILGKSPYLPESTNKLLLHFDERSGDKAVDSSPRSDITIQNGTIWTDGKYGKAFKFDGTNYINVSGANNYAGLDITDNLTVECWAKWDGTGEGYMIMKGNAYGIKLNSGHGIDGVVAVDNQWRVVQSGYVISPNTWTHIAMTYSSNTHAMEIYVNGVLKATNILTGLGSYSIYSSGNDLTVGRDAQNWGEVFHGAIDEVCVSNTVKTSFDRSIPLLCDTNTRLLLDFNEGQGSIVADSSGKNGASATGGNRHVSAKFGRSAEFSGSNYIRVADSSSLDITDELSIDCWAKWDGTGDGYILMKSDAYGLKLNSGHGIDGVVYVDGSWRECQTGYVIRASEWTHITMTYSAGTHVIRMYINGELKQTTILDGLSTYYINTTPIDPNYNELDIGRAAKNWSEYFHGCVDEVRISNTLRYNTMLDVPFTSDNKAAILLHFDESSGATVTDSSSSGNNGTFQVSTSRVDGKYGGAIETSDSRYFSVADRSSLHIVDELTVEGWFKWDGTGPDQQYMVLKGHAYGIDFIGTGSNTNIQAVLYIDGAYRSLYSNYAMPVDTWTHIAITYSSTTHEIKIYVNGTLQNSTTLTNLSSYTIDTAWSNDLVVGRDGLGWGAYFHGCADDVCVSNTVKSSFPLQ